MADGVRWDAIWAIEGEVRESISYLDEVWTGGESGEWWVCHFSEGAIEEGIWDLTLNVEGEWVAGSFVGLGDSLEPVEVTFTNTGAAQAICYLYIAPDVTPFWGTDWLDPDDIVEPGESVVYNLPPNLYDLRGDDCDGNTLFEETRQIAEPLELTYG